MINDYLIVNKKILPSYYEKVVRARDLLESNKCKSVSDATREVGISRSTYYKYKDYIFTPTENFAERFTLSLKLDDKAGTLSDILSIISESRASIVTIHQDVPINQNAIVVMTLDGREMECSIEAFLKTLQKIEHVNDVKLLAVE